MKLVYVLLALALVRNILLYKTYHSVSVLELKRRARQPDKKSAALYRVASYGAVLDVRQWIFCTTVATVLLIWSARTDWWLAAIVSVVIAWLSVWSKSSAEGWAGSLAALWAPFDARVLAILQPVLGRIAGWLPPGRVGPVHTKLYEKKDLLELLGKQNKQVDNRIPESDLKIAYNSMIFGDKTVGSIMTPQRQVKLVKYDETVGPLLMDELHKSGFSRFPVVKDSTKTATPEVVGTLYLNDLIGFEGNAKVKDVAKRDVFFVNEDSNLRQALNAFLKTHHHLLVVVNSFEEMVGVITLEDVLEQILGKQIIDEFDSFANLRAVAAMNAKKEAAGHQEIKPEQTAQTVVE